MSYIDPHQPTLGSVVLDAGSRPERVLTFMPSQHLRPSSGREHTIVQLIQSGDDDYSMNETRKQTTIGRQSPSLFDKWHGIFYMPSRTGTAGHTSVVFHGVINVNTKAARVETMCLFILCRLSPGIP